MYRKQVKRRVKILAKLKKFGIENARKSEKSSDEMLRKKILITKEKLLAFTLMK